MIHIIYPNTYDYSVFTFNNEEVWAKLGEDVFIQADPSPPPYSNQWQTLTLTFSNYTGQGKQKPIPDLITDYGKLFLSEKAYQALRPLLSSHGEFLPITYENGKGYLFNPLRIADDVDGLNTKLSIKNEYDEMESLFFHEQVVAGFPVFKTTFDGFMGIYCHDNFKSIVDKEHLTGVTFGIDLSHIFPPDPSGDTEDPVSN